jgi:glycosyltransferase involved in cell wall biosynthesis
VARSKLPTKLKPNLGLVREKRRGKVPSAPDRVGTRLARLGDRESFLSALSFRSPDRIVLSAWHEHAPFAFWLVEKLGPRLLIELGTHNGFSYFAFCQGIRMAGLDAAAFAVDRWTGDEHAGFYGEEVYQGVAAYNGERYSDISTLMRMDFSDALQYFEDGSVDLLHIDGRHHYDDVKSDFESWLPKLSARSVVLIHDTNVREREFGVHRFWSEMSKEYPNFHFTHGNGLGVLGVGRKCPSRVAALFGASSDAPLTASIRNAYARLGRAVTLAFEASQAWQLRSVAVQEADTLRSERDLSRVRQSEILAEKDAARAEFTASVGEAERALSEAARDKDALKQTLAASVAESAALGDERVRIALELKLREGELTEKASALAGIEERLRVAEANYAAAAQEAGELRPEREALRQRIAELADEQSRLRAEAEKTAAELKDELDRAFATLSAERQKAAEQKDQLTDLGERLRVAEANYAAAAQEAGELRPEREALQQRIAELADEQSRLRAEAEKTAAELKDELDRAFATLSAERQKAAEQKDQLTDLGERLKVAEADCATRAVEAERKRQEALRNKEAFSRSLAETLAALDLARTGETTKEAARIELTGKLDRALEENQGLAVRLEGISSELQRTRDQASERAAAGEAAHAKALVEAQMAHEARIHALRGQLVDAEAALASTRTKGPRKGLRAWLTSAAANRRRLAKRLLRSGLFDAEFYRTTYPATISNVPKGGTNGEFAAAEHYLEEGFCQGFRPNALFDTRWYLDRYDDVRRSGVNPLLHYLLDGWREGRDPGPEFDTDLYLEAYPDVREAGVNPLAHYLSHGRQEGRLAVPASRKRVQTDAPIAPPDQRRADPDVELIANSGLFDGGFYAGADEARAMGIGPIEHYIVSGQVAGLAPSALFDTSWYLEHYPDVRASGVNPLRHYIESGAADGHDPNPLFDTSWYLEHYPDVRASGINPLRHYIEFGAAEGRDPNAQFDSSWYLATYRDVREAGLNPLAHYLRYGMNENRKVNPATLDRAAIRRHVASLAFKPLISVVMPVYDPPIEFLRKAIESVIAQSYPLWELCIANDASTNPEVPRVLDKFAASDRRIRVVHRERNGNICAASNSALELAEGEFVALMDHDDLLHETALYEVAVEINAYPNVDIIYSDEDKVDEDNRHYGHYFKTDFNPELLLGQNVISHLGVYRRNLLESIGGFRLGYEGSQDFDLALRAWAASSNDRIRHIPAVLYHWRQGTQAPSFSEARLGQCTTAARKAIQEFLDQEGEGAMVVAAPKVSNYSRVIRQIPEPKPLVSVVILTKDRADLMSVCTDGILNKTDYPNLELLIVDHESKEAATHALFEKLKSDSRVRIIPYAGAFNFSAMNNLAAATANGTVLALVNNDVEILAPDWLSEMVSHAIRPEIGAVGAKLYYPDGRIQHAGVIVGLGGVAGHSFLFEKADSPGYFGQAMLTRTVSAVTAACLVVRKSVFLEVQGLDTTAFPVAFNDVDFCLKVRAKGYRNVWTPFAELVHHESLSRGNDDTPEKQTRFARESANFRSRWGELIENDPYYNPNLSLDSWKYEVARIFRRKKPWAAYIQL